MESERPAAPSPPSRPSAWNTRAVVLFAFILAILSGIGLASWLYRPTPPSGLPDDPGVREALDLLGGSLEASVGELRLVTSLGENEGVPARRDSSRARRLLDAGFRLEQGRARHRFDPRFDCLLGHVALASDRLDLAERHYRAALSLSPRYAEARLALGVTLALRAALEDEKGSARGHRLEAIAQFAAIDEKDPLYLPALYDRVLVLLEVNRKKEAQRLSDHYAQLDPGSVWTGVLRRKFDRG